MYVVVMEHQILERRVKGNIVREKYDKTLMFSLGCYLDECQRYALNLQLGGLLKQQYGVHDIQLV